MIWKQTDLNRVYSVQMQFETFFLKMIRFGIIYRLSNVHFEQNLFLEFKI